MTHDFNPMESDKIKSDDRILVLKPLEGENTLNSKGMIDNRLFKGGNRLHVIKDPATMFWSFRYDTGLVEEPLRQKFTSFPKAEKFAREHFAKRNIQIVEVKE